MEEVVIFVAGNPDLYPLEYYNAGTESYEGVIPELLARFSEQSRYQVRYLQPGVSDRRSHLAENRQVDLISGCAPGESFPHSNTDGITVVEALEDGESVIYQLLFTDLAPESFQAELRQFFAQVSQEERTGLLLQVREDVRDARSDLMRNGLIGLAVAILVLLAVLAAVICRYRRRLRRDEQSKETDEVTGIGNEAFLTHNYPLLVTDRTRILYTAVCFYTDTDKMDRMCGHEDTVQFLRHTAAILNEYADQRDLLARVAGVGLVLLKSTSADTVQQWLPTALARIREFSRLYGKPYSCEVNCGVYPLQSDDRDLDEILIKTLQSAQMACREETDYVLCSQDILRKIDQERQLQGEIALAFEREEFQLYIQFYVNARTYEIVGGEALARWQHPEKGFLTPGHFIPMMERENMIDRMDYYILEKACAFLDRMEKCRVQDFFISCNFSRKSFGAADFVERCGEIIRRYTFSRELLIFELTESVQARDAGQVLQNTRRVKGELGVQVVLDDFGAGFTSFYDLQEYPVDGIKLDKELVDHVNTPKGRAIMRVMVQIGHELGLTTLAEGVENDEQLGILQELRCDAIQGFRFYYPIPAWEAEEKLLGGRL